MSAKVHTSERMARVLVWQRCTASACSWVALRRPGRADGAFPIGMRGPRSRVALTVRGPASRSGRWPSCMSSGGAVGRRGCVDEAMRRRLAVVGDAGRPRECCGCMDARMRAGWETDGQGGRLPAPSREFGYSRRCGTTWAGFAQYS